MAAANGTEYSKKKKDQKHLAFWCWGKRVFLLFVVVIISEAWKEHVERERDESKLCWTSREMAPVNKPIASFNDDLSGLIKTWIKQSLLEPQKDKLCCINRLFMLW